jgi:hypothetical protein
MKLQAFTLHHLERFVQTVKYSHRHPKILGLSIDHSYCASISKDSNHLAHHRFLGLTILARM